MDTVDVWYQRLLRESRQAGVKYFDTPMRTYPWIQVRSMYFDSPNCVLR